MEGKILATSNLGMRFSGRKLFEDVNIKNLELLYYC